MSVNPADREFLTLSNVAEGCADEKFARELQAVLDNIADPNTKAKAKRTITMTVTFEPDENREDLVVFLEAKSKLVPAKAHGQRAFLGKLPGGKLVAVNINPRQMPLPGTGGTTNVAPFAAQEPPA